MSYPAYKPSGSRENLNLDPWPPTGNGPTCDLASWLRGCECSICSSGTPRRADRSSGADDSDDKQPLDRSLEQSESDGEFSRPGTPKQSDDLERESHRYQGEPCGLNSTAQINHASFLLGNMRRSNSLSPSPNGQQVQQYQRTHSPGFPYLENRPVSGYSLFVRRADRIER